MTIAPLTIDEFSPPKSHAPGPAPMLQWIEVALLRVDRSYQRDIKKAGARNVARIIERFDWSKFAPVLVAPIEGGLYAIIDGQHRATAALACGIEKVPCQIVQADRAKQASAFAAVNGQVSPVSAMQLHAASVAAGDATAAAIQRVAAAADVVILRWPKHTTEMKPNETMAVGTIKNAIRFYGEDVTIAALKAISQSGDGCNGGALVQPIILGVGAVLALSRAWVDHPDLVAVCDDFDFLGMYERARSIRGIAAKTTIAKLFSDHLEKRIG